MTPQLFQLVNALLSAQPGEEEKLFALAESQGLAPPDDYPEIAVQMFAQPQGPQPAQPNIAQRNAQNPAPSAMPPTDMIFPVARNAR